MEADNWKPDDKIKDVVPPWEIITTSDKCKVERTRRTVEFLGEEPFHKVYLLCSLTYAPCTDFNCSIKAK
jgi:hypothetical protein